MEYQVRPEWLENDPCPAWCTKNHPPDELPQDRAHSHPLIFVPVIEATDPPFEGGRPSGAEYVIDMRRYAGAQETWVYIGPETNTDRSICVTAESARRLGYALQEVMGRGTE